MTTSSFLWDDGGRVGGSAISTRIARYRISAKKKGLVWRLTKAEFEDITARDCRYCGSSPTNLQRHAGNVFTYNGIDRVDNRQGYTLDNSVPCCRSCNSAKGKLGVSEFLEWVRRIVNHSLPFCEP